MAGVGLKVDNINITNRTQSNAFYTCSYMYHILITSREKVLNKYLNMQIEKFMTYVYNR